jgi:type II secretory pathway component PulC
MMRDKKKIVAVAIATGAGILLGTIALVVINASLLRYPEPSAPAAGAPAPVSTQAPATVEPDYKAISDRNLFRAKLQVEIPKPKTDKEIEEEMLAGIVKTMALKGVVLGVKKKDQYAVIDRGAQKGVWTYEIGDTIEKGLIVKEIGKDSVKLEKDQFAAVLKLFSGVYERAEGARAGAPVLRPLRGTPQAKGAGKRDYSKDIRKEGAVTLVSKSLVDKLKSDNTAIMSSIAVRAAADGLQVVAVDQGSIAQRMGITANDTLQEVNGYKLNSSADMTKVYEALKNATSFEVRLMRRGKPETLRYEIR